MKGHIKLARKRYSCAIHLMNDFLSLIIYLEKDHVGALKNGIYILVKSNKTRADEHAENHLCSPTLAWNMSLDVCCNAIDDTESHVSPFTSFPYCAIFNPRMT